MFHYFEWSIKNIWSEYFLVNQSFWIQIYYIWQQKEGCFFLYPYIDDQKKTIFYYCFDSFKQKSFFETLLKISWIGPKTAMQIVQIPLNELSESINNLDIKIFQSIPWIGPKLAKKIILELKWNFSLSDVEKSDQDQKYFKSVVKSLKGLGYDPQRVKETLKDYPEKLNENNLTDAVKRVISQM